jgi:hypothetical protein
MTLAGQVHVPLAMPLLAALAGWLAWLLAQGKPQRRLSAHPRPNPSEFGCPSRSSHRPFAGLS